MLHPLHRFNACRNGKIVAIPSGDLFFFGLGTGEYNELAGMYTLQLSSTSISTSQRQPSTLSPSSIHHVAVYELLQALIQIYKDIFKVPSLSDTILFQNFAQTIIVIDEACKEGYIEHIDKASMQKALLFRLPFIGDGTERKGLIGRFSSRDF